MRCSKMIDRQLRQKKLKARNECNILLLGCGDVGKTTFVKQMRIIYGEDYSEEDRLEFRPMIYHNILRGTKILIEARRQLQIPLQLPQNERNGQKISTYHREGYISDDEFQPYVESLMAVWKDGAIQRTWNRRNEFQIVSIIHVIHVSILLCTVDREIFIVKKFSWVFTNFFFFFMYKVYFCKCTFCIQLSLNR